MPQTTPRVIDMSDKIIGLDIQGMSITQKPTEAKNQSYAIVDRKPKLAKNVCKQN